MPTPGRSFLPFCLLSCRCGIRFLCLTTPADSPEGRDAHLWRTESPQTLERWRDASRRYPPLVKVADRWIYGRCVSATRCKLLGNAWHAGVARLLVFVLLCHAQVMQAHEVTTQPSMIRFQTLPFRFAGIQRGRPPLATCGRLVAPLGLTWDPNEPKPPELESPDSGPFYISPGQGL